jgi:hypothetical protein
MAWNPNNPSQRLQKQAQQQQQHMHRHFQQFAAKQQKGLMDQWRARQAHQAAQMAARQQEDDEASPQLRYREDWPGGTASADEDDDASPQLMYLEDWPGGTASAGAARIGQFLALISAIVFTASVTVLTSYVDNGTGGKSLWQATHGDLASPLYPKNFWILIGLVALAFVATFMSLRMYRRSFMIGAAAASAGLIAYTLYIPRIGHFPGFGPYGSAYWISLIATIAMALGAGVAAVTRSAP